MARASRFDVGPAAGVLLVRLGCIAAPLLAAALLLDDRGGWPAVGAFVAAMAVSSALQGWAVRRVFGRVRCSVERLSERLLGWALIATFGVLGVVALLGRDEGWGGRWWAGAGVGPLMAAGLLAAWGGMGGRGRGEARRAAGRVGPGLE